MPGSRTDIVTDEEWILPEIDFDLCNGCGACTRACATHAVEMVGPRPLITNPEACTYCAACGEICPEGAITVLVEFIFKS